LFSGKIIFIAPVDWGLGHSTRCVPIIKELSQSNRVIIGVTGQNKFFFEKIFPDLEKFSLASYNITYSAYLPAWLKILVQAPRILYTIRKEKGLAKLIAGKLKADIIISDNRFGLRSQQTKNVFITHQVNIKMNLIGDLATFLNRAFISKFDELWIPDYEEKEKRLSGSLSETFGMTIPVKFIGPKSMLTRTQSNENFKYDYLVILSGPEPQRTVLEKIIVKKLSGIREKVFIVRGVMEVNEVNQTYNNILDFAFHDQLSELVVNSRTVICRSGYSTLMDMHFCGKKNLVLVPTPGQPEQEYLAGYWSKKFGAKISWNNLEDWEPDQSD
jgi:uncharacterized protein (TIGR00661 family)